MPFNTVTAEIVSKYNEFTKVEKIIADYFINNDKEEDFSINSVAKRLYVSEASFSRFAKKLGFRGYREFVSSYEMNFTGNHPTAALYDEKNVIGVYQDILNAFMATIDNQTLVAVAKTMMTAQRVMVAGVGSSGLAGEEMKRRFMRLGLLIESCDQPDLIRMQSVFTDEHTFVIGLSLSGSQEDIECMLLQAHYHKSKTLLISGANAYKEYIDYHLRVPMLKNMDAGHLISPQFPLLVVIDMIYHQCLKLNAKSKINHQETLNALKKR